MARFLADENISLLTVRHLRKLGYDVKDLSKEGKTGLTDEQLVNLAEKEERMIITFDLDFGEIYYFAAKTHVGIIVLRIRPQTIEHANEVLERFLKSRMIKEENLEKALIIVDEKRVRFRKGD